jgi:hypothetical protein
MITNDSELEQTIRQLERMYRAIAELKSRILPQNERNFQLLAEGPADEIRKLQREIEEYLGIDSRLAAT